MSYCELVEKIYALHSGLSPEAARALVEESFERGEIDERERRLLLGTK